MKTKGQILLFLEELRNANPIVKDMFLVGSCFNLYMALRALFPEAKCYYSQKHGHAITKIEGCYYDISGEIKDITGYYDISTIWTYNYKDETKFREEEMYVSRNKTKYIPILSRKGAKNVILENMAYCMRDDKELNKLETATLGDVENIMVKYADKILDDLGIV